MDKLNAGHNSSPPPAPITAPTTPEIEVRQLKRRASTSPPKPKKQPYQRQLTIKQTMNQKPKKKSLKDAPRAKPETSSDPDDEEQVDSRNHAVQREHNQLSSQQKELYENKNIKTPTIPTTINYHFPQSTLLNQFNPSKSPKTPPKLVPVKRQLTTPKQPRKETDSKQVHPYTGGKGHYTLGGKTPYKVNIPKPKQPVQKSNSSDFEEEKDEEHSPITLSEIEDIADSHRRSDSNNESDE
jgi:hypothetical protein